MAPGLHSSSEAPKRVFVTVGTTAFDDLVKEVLTPKVIQQLSDDGYELIRVQYGSGLGAFTEAKTQDLDKLSEEKGIKIEGFDYTDGETITQTIKASTLIISHAGSGTILDALRYQKAIIVVPNPSLMDNHQAELADAMSKQKYVIKGILGNLSTAVDAVQNYPFKHFPRAGSKVFIETLEDELCKAEKDKMYG